MADAILNAAQAATPSDRGHSPAPTDQHAHVEMTTPEAIAEHAYRAFLNSSPHEFSKAIGELLRADPAVAQDGLSATSCVRAFADVLYRYIGDAIRDSFKVDVLTAFGLDKPQDLEYAEHLAHMAHHLCELAINDPDEHEALLNGAKTLIEKSRAIMLIVDAGQRGAA